MDLTAYAVQVAVAAIFLSLCGLSSCSGKPPHGIDIIPSGRWEIRVRDDGGKAISGAQLVPQYDGTDRRKDRSFDEFRAGREVTTDTQGRAILTRARTATLPAPFAWEKWRIRVSASGYGDVSVSVKDILDKAPRMEIVLPRRTHPDRSG